MQIRFVLIADDSRQEYMLSVAIPLLLSRLNIGIDNTKTEYPFL